MSEEAARPLPADREATAGDPEALRPIRCLVADDHPALVAAVSEYLKGHGFEIVGHARDGLAAVESVRVAKPDVAVIDYRMPRLEGPELIAQLLKQAPEMLIAVYTAVSEESVVGAVFESGAHALILKDAHLDDLVAALQTIAAGGRYVDPALARVALGASTPKPSLTPRETQVLAHVADGLSQEEIGRRLSISPETVRTHVRKACERLDARTRTHAVAKALRLGLFS
jgi:two-component system NarL family response regulator